jgi:hypothetical protein
MIENLSTGGLNSKNVGWSDVIELYEKVNEIINHLNCLHEDGLHIPKAAVQPIRVASGCCHCSELTGDGTYRCEVCGRMV